MFLTSDNLKSQRRIRHGFFGRKGGVSGGIYGSLNCGQGSSDKKDHVRENRCLVAKAMDASVENLCTQYQIHSVLVTEVTKPWSLGDSPQTDAMVTNTSGVVLGILTADCAPILFADEEAGVIGAAHAGWKGAIGGISEATVKAMERLGARPERITVAVGPCISQASYEVSESFLEPFKAQNTELEKFFKKSESKPDKYHFDLKAYVGHRLALAGVLDVNLLANDTCFEEDDFFSYRRSTLRNEPDYGRHISTIMLTT